MIGHLHITTGLVGIEEDEQIRCAVALTFAIVSRGLARRGQNRQTGLADQLVRAFVEAPRPNVGARSRAIGYRAR